MNTASPDPATRSVPSTGGPIVPPEGLQSFLWAKIRRHKVVEWTIAYVAFVYAVLHGAQLLSDMQEWPHAVVRLLSLALTLGVPIVATLAWFQGHRAERRLRGAEIAILTVLVFGLGTTLWWLSSTHGDRRVTAAVGSMVPAARFATAAAAPEKSIAVLPFLDMSEKKDQEYFSDGLSEELIDLLTKIPELRVPARTSSFYFKGQHATIAEIAKALGVAHVLEGSVRKAGNTIRVTAQLVRADNGYHLWSETYDRDLEDVFKVQDGIADAVVAALKLKLSPGQQTPNSRRTSNTQAYNEYLLGRQFFERGNLDDNRRAAEAFRKAIQLDPRFAAAYAELAISESFVADMSGEAEGFQQAIAAADKAVELAPNEAAGYAARGYQRLYTSWDWIGAQADFEKALAFDPGDSTVQRRYGQLLASLGRLPEGIAAMKRATELDPLSSTAWSTIGRYLLANQQFGAAQEALRRAVQIQPTSVYALSDLGTLQLVEGHAAEALNTFRKVSLEEIRLPGIAIAQHTLGRVKESQQALDEAIAKSAQDAAYQIAQVYAWRHEKEKAFSWLERAYSQRDGGLSEIKIDVLLSSLHGDPRFLAMLRKMHLPE